MVYIEHYLAEAGVVRLRHAVILRPSVDGWVDQHLRAELQDVFPEALVDVTDWSDVPAGVDLVVLPLLGPFGFPFHDVVHESLGDVARLMRLRERAGHFMIYRANWRGVDVVAARELRQWLRRRRVEKVLTQACRHLAPLQRLFRPRFPS